MEIKAVPAHIRRTYVDGGSGAFASDMVWLVSGMIAAIPASKK